MAVTYNTPITPGYAYQYAGAAYSANLKGTTGYSYFLATAAVNDAFYWGYDLWFDDILVYLGQAFAASSVTFVWEYYNGSTWTTLTVTDGTTNWTVTGSQVTVAFVPPIDWVPVAINSVTTLWVRCRISAVNTPTQSADNSTQADQVGDNIMTVTGTGNTYATLAAAFPNVVEALSTAMYRIRCKIYIGDSITATTFTDTSKLIEWRPRTKNYATETLLYVRDNASYTEGVLLDAVRKIGFQGCSHIIYNFSYTRFACESITKGTMRLYGSKIDDISGGFGGTAFTALGTNCHLYCLELYAVNISQCAVDSNRITQYAYRPVSYPSVTSIQNDMVIAPTYAVIASSSGAGVHVLTNSIIIGADGSSKYVAIFFGFSTMDIYLVNCIADNYTPLYSGGGYTNSLYRQFTFALELQDKDGTAQAGKVVKMVNDNGDTVFEETTDANGNITFSGQHSSSESNAVSYKWYYYSGGAQEQDYSPFKLYIDGAHVATYGSDDVELWEANGGANLVGPIGGGGGGFPILGG